LVRFRYEGKVTLPGSLGHYEEVRRAFAAIVLLALIGSDAAPVFADRWYAPAPVLGIIDAGRQTTAAIDAGASWDRALFLWQEIQQNSPSDWTLDQYIDNAHLGPTLRSGMPVVGVVQGTPQWAAGRTSDGASAVPTGLDYPPDDPRNTFGQFMLRLARTYKGRITTWIIWNEPDFLPGESGTWWTWSGNTADFGRVLKTGYQAVKMVDPSATVVFPATTYFADAVHNRELFLGRVLKDLSADKDAARNGYYFDAVGVNLYCSLDAIYRVHGVYQSILDQYHLAKPIWLTETNCPVYNDATVPEPPVGRISTDEQSAFLIQDIALARAAGYARIGWYSMIDHDASSGIVDRWGLLRADGSTRPAFRAFQVAEQYLARPGSTASLAPLGEASADGWQVSRVILDDPAGRTRVQVLWRTSRGPATVHVEASSSSARIVDINGYSTPAVRTDNGWDVPLPAVRVPQPSDPPGFQSTGYPTLLVETNVGSGATALPGVTSPLVALSPAVVPVAVAAPAPGATPQPNAGAPVPTIAPALIQPGPSLVLNVANPQPNDVLPRGRYVIAGQAFDRAATAGSGVDRVSAFVDDRDSGGQHLADATLGQPTATGFTLTADLSRLSGTHSLFIYARSSVTGKETVVNFPIAIGSR
jgi:hypothetical protein